MARDFETVCDCIIRDVYILQRMFIRAPLYPRHNMWVICERVLEAALVCERMALGIDVWGELHFKESNEKTPSAIDAQGLAVAQVEETCDD